MTQELALLDWTIVLAGVHILLPAYSRMAETGALFALGPRDDDGPSVSVRTARLRRAQGNFFETFPLFAAAILVAHVAKTDGALTLWGAWLYFIARIIYLPLYAFGIPVIRSLVWGVSGLGLALILLASLTMPF